MAAWVLSLLGAVGMGDASETAAESGLFPFVLPWDDASAGATDLSGWLEKPAGKHGGVVARDGHLYVGERRIRFFGVNLCFGACFPRHKDAERIAARMAKFGITCVRFHHMDMSAAPNGIFKPDRRTLDPGQLDKLDYLVAQLKAHGIYVNLNLHASRTYPGLPKWDGMPSFHKGVDTFVPRMIEMQRQYARDLLTHVNPYTKTRYADEPAVAIVEINNENGLLHAWLAANLDAMPNRYASELARQWNDWLKARYADTKTLKTAWGEANQPVRTELLTNGDFTAGTHPWVLDRHEGAAAEVTVVPDGPGGRPALRHRIGLRVGPRPPRVATVPTPKPLTAKVHTSDTGQVVWDLTTPGKGSVRVNAPRTRAVIGFTDGTEISLGDVTIRPGRTRQGWCTIGLTLTEGESFAGPARALVIATGYAENTGMRWLNEAHTTVGRQWGRAPSRVEGISAAIRLPAPADRVRAWALDERDQRTAEVAVRAAAGRAEVHIGPQHRTLWYELAIAE